MRHSKRHENVKKFDNAVVNELFECMKINKYDYESIIMGRVLLCFQYSLRNLYNHPNIQCTKSEMYLNDSCFLFYCLLSNTIQGY